MKAPKFLLLILLSSAGMTGNIFATIGTWSGTSNGTWVNSANWLGGTVPGSTSTNGNGDTAIFNTSTGVTVTLATRGIDVVDFDTNVGSFTLSFGGLYVASGGGINLLSTVTSTNQTETINSPVTAHGSFGINNSSTSDVFDFTGAMTSNSTTANETWSLSGTNTGANTLGGVISNGGTFTVAISKSGTGTWILGGANTYTGGTVVGVGTLLANNSTSATGTGSVSVSSGGTLGGIGTITPTTVVGTNKVIISAGGTLAPGTIGNTNTLTISATGNANPSGLLALTSGASGSILSFNLGAGNTASKLSLTSAFASEVTGLSGNVFNFTDLTTGSLATGEYTLIQTDDSTTNPFSGLSLGTLSGFTLNGLSAYAGDTVQLELNQLIGTNDYALQLDIESGAVPEPGTWAMMLGGMAMLSLVLRRKKDRSCAS